MTQEEFVNKFRGRMLLFVTEAWAIRKEPPTEAGLVLDIHHVRAVELMRQMYNVLNPPPAPPKGPVK